MVNFEERRNTDYMTVDLCAEKEKNKDMQICGVNDSLKELKLMFGTMMATIKEESTHRIAIEAQLFEGQKTLSVLLAETVSKEDSTQRELSDHKEDNSHLTLTTIIGGITILSAIFTAILFVMGKIRI